jgi:tRNA dimethylallyltransferase
MLPLHHNFFLMNRRADISIFTSLLFLILFQGCVAKRLGKQAARFESAGMFAKAADLYYKASLKKPNVVEFKTGLRRSGQIHLEELSQLVNQAYINRDYHKAVYDFLALKGFLNKVKYAGVELNIDYSTQRIFENARELYLSDRYEYGQKLIGESDFDEAKKVFNEIHQILPDFRDTRSYLNMATIEPIYLRGVNLFSQRKYMDAYQEWEKVTMYDGGYKDVNSLMHQALNERYKEGVLFLINENFSAAALALGEVYKKNPKFEDVKNLYLEARNEPIYRSAMVDLNAGKCRAAYYGFEKVIADVGAYKDAAAKRKRALDCAQYPIALATGKISDNQKEITERGKKVIVCGGSGLHLETALGLYTLEKAPEDQQFRHEASTMSHDELVQILAKLTKLHNTTDITDRNRLIRAIEVAKASHFVNKTEDTEQKISKANKNLIFGIKMPREIIRQRISTRLQLRLNEGMIDEVEGLLKNDLKPEDIIYYGLEYKYITLYLIGEIDYNEMYEKLNTAIHQFAKRQMTWFRRMEKKGIKIQWLDGMNEPEKIALQITDIVGRTNYTS